MKKKTMQQVGQAEIRTALKQNRKLLWAIGVFSFFVNILMLTSPIYMLQVYDRVLSSRSLETLAALSVLVLSLYVMMGLLDFVRGRVLTRIGARFFDSLSPRVFDVSQDSTASGMASGEAKVALRDLEAMQKAIASPITSSFFDLPWTPVFLAVIAIFHPYLGLLALAGGIVLVIFALINQLASKTKVDTANMMGSSAHLFADGIRDNAELVQGLGMKQSAMGKWLKIRQMAVNSELNATDLTGGFQTATRTFRMALQSAMLGLGAYLVLTDGLTPGAMIAASIIMGRAIAPIESLLGQWPVMQRAMQARERLSQLLGETPKRPDPMDLGRPQAKLAVQQISLIPPAPRPNMNKPTLRGVDFTMEPGQALGVIGNSGSGKSSLARALIGVWHPASGKVRLDGASLDQYDPSQLGSYIGYLPQNVALFDGTIAENIARLSATPDPEKIRTAAKKAAVHDMILQLPKGYDTTIQTAGSRLSGGQIQRIGLARALYGDPLLLVLDEPNSSLDNEGTQALNIAVAHAKKDGRAVIIMAHRPAALQLCDLILVLENGHQRAFGKKDDVLRETIKNHQDIRSVTSKPSPPAQAG